MKKTTTGNSAIIVAALAALLATQALAGPAGTAGKVAGRATAKVIGREVAEEAAERTAREAAEKVAVRVAREVAEEAAATATRKAAERTVAEKIVEVVARPRVVLAGGAAAAMAVGAHNVSKGARTAMEDVGESVKDIAEKHPEMLPDVIKEGTRPVRSLANSIQCVVGLAFICLAAWFFAAPLRLLRARITARAERAMREARPARQASFSGEVIDGEFEIRDAGGTGTVASQS